nr:hypothetical protein [Tanacetum cinerariifolium]
MRKEMQMSMLKMLILVMLLKEMLMLLMAKFLLLLKNHPYHLLHHLLHHHNKLMISLQLLRVEHLEFDKVAQALEITKLKRRVKKLERRNKVRVLKLRRLQKVRTSQKVETSEETMMDDESNQGRMIDEMDQDDDEDETEPAKVQEVVDVVTTAKLITVVITAASEIVTAASAIITAAETQVPAATTDVTLIAAPSRRRKGVTEAQARKNMMLYLKNVVGFKMDYFKGMSYDDIRPIFEAKFDSNVDFLLKTKKQIEEDENRALQRLNETLAERAAKRRKLDEEVEELKRHLQIMPNKDDDVYTEATSLA